MKEALLRPEQLPLQQPDPPSFPGDHQAPVKLYTHIRAHAQCMKSLAHLNCGNYLLKLGRELALFPSAQAGAGGVRANEGRKTCRTSLGGEKFCHVVAGVVSSDYRYMHMHYYCDDTTCTTAANV